MLRRERKEKKIRKKIYSICVRTVSYLRRYCSGVPNFLAFGTPHEGLFLLFGVPNAKYWHLAHLMIVLYFSDLLGVNSKRELFFLIIEDEQLRLNGTRIFVLKVETQKDFH